MRLRELEAEGLVQRQVFEGTPVRVEYALTDMGRDLERSLSELRLWARQVAQSSLDSALRPTRLAKELP